MLILIDIDKIRVMTLVTNKLNVVRVSKLNLCFELFMIIVYFIFLIVFINDFLINWQIMLLMFFQS